jgi:hypothetical protein
MEGTIISNEINVSQRINIKLAQRQKPWKFKIQQTITKKI